MIESSDVSVGYLEFYKWNAALANSYIDNLLKIIYIYIVT